MTQPNTIERRIESLRFEANEGEWRVEFVRERAGWLRTEQDLDEEGYGLDSRSHSHVTSLAQEVADFAATYLTVTDVEVSGIPADDFLRWVRPFLDEDQDSIVINGHGYDLYED